MRMYLTLAVVLSLGGCATVTRGTTEQVTFTSEPPGAQMVTSIGLQCPTTPCTLEIARKAEFVATFSKPGFVDEQINVTTQLAGAGAAGFAGNVLIGGAVGMGVDVATGATLEHKPNPVHAILRAAVVPKPEPGPKKIPHKGARTPVS